MRYLLAALTLAACQPLESQPGPQGPAGPPGPMGVMGTPGRDSSGVNGNKDGTRLRVRYIYTAVTAEDGARIEGERTAIPWDTKLNVRCSSILGEDAQYHCLPRYADIAIGGPYYFDSSCQRRAVIVSAADTHAGQLVGAQARIYALGQELKGQQIYIKDGTCRARPDPVPVGQIARELGDVIPPSEFVKTSLAWEMTP